MTPPIWKSRTAALLVFLAMVLLCPSMQSGAALRGQVVLLPRDEPLLEEETVTRDDLARILISYSPRKLLVRLSGSRPVPDHESEPVEVRDFLDRTGILPRFPDGSFHPADPVHRNHLAIVLRRIAGKIDGLPPVDELVPAPVDVPPSRYDRLPIRVVLTLGLMRTDESGRFRPDDPLTGREAIEATTSLSRLPAPPGVEDRKNP